MSFAHQSCPKGDTGLQGPPGVGEQGIQGEQGPPGEDAPDNFLDLVDTPDSYVGQAGQVVAVKATEDVLEFIAPGGGVSDHGLLDGLADNDHPQYALAGAVIVPLHPTLRVGYYHFPFSAGPAASTYALQNNFIYGTGFLVPVLATFDRIGIYVAYAAPAAPKEARLGVYADDGNLHPGALLLDAGLVSTATIATKQLTIDLQLDPGLYWLAFLQGGGAGLQSSLYAVNLGAFTYPYIAPSTIFDYGQAYGPLPDTFPADAAPFTDRALIAIALRCSSIP